MAEKYDVGDMPRIWCHFTELPAFGETTGAPADPDTVTCIVRSPDGTQSTPTPETTGTVGEWYVDVPITRHGTWTVYLAGTGAVTAAAETFIEVRTPGVTIT